MPNESLNMCEACPACQTALLDQEHLAFQLQEARAAAEAAAEAKSVFLANLSHEIRTPLNGMIAIAQLLMRTTLSPEQRELASTLEESGSALLSILGDVLDFSSIGINDIDINSQPVWLREVIEGCIEAAAPSAKSKGVHLSYRLSPAFAQHQIAIDQVRLRQVLLYFVNNAVKFNKECGEVEIVAATVDDGATLCLSVRDTGIGMDKEAIDSLFANGFHQTESSLKRRHGGAGLGLAIASRLARLMGGSIQVESTPGCGSTFSFSLPLTWVKSGKEESAVPTTITTTTTTNCDDCTTTTTQPYLETDPDTPSVASQRGLCSGSTHHRYLCSSFTSLTDASSSLAASSASLGDIHGAPSTANLSTFSGDSNSDSSPVGTGKSSSLDLLPASRRSSADGAHGVGGGNRYSLGLPPLPGRSTPAASADFRTSSFFTGGCSTAPGTNTHGLVPAPIATTATTLAAAPDSPPPEVEVDSPKGSSSTRESAVSSSPSAPGLINLSGRTIFIDVPHDPTALQLKDSCQLAGMAVVVMVGGRAVTTTNSADNNNDNTNNSNKDVNSTAEVEVPDLYCDADVCITTPMRAFHVLRNGWKSRPVVVIGSRDEVPLVIQPAVVVVSSPIQHSRLLGSLRKALAPCIAALETPLHSDPSVLLQHAAAAGNSGGGSGNGNGGGNGTNRGPCRHSLDNSAFDRRQIFQLSSAALRQRDGNQSRYFAAAAPPASTTTGGWVPKLAAVRSNSPTSPRGEDEDQELHEIPENNALDTTTTTAAAAAAGLEQPECDKHHQKEAFSILVAEDNLINVRVVLRVLHHVLPAADVDVVNNGLEVLQATAMKRYDLLLLDIHMPEMDGLEAAEKLQHMVPPDRLPTIVALSADTMESSRQRCAEVGIVDFVSKPFRIEDVERVVAMVKERKAVF